jgi:hypothetical protein
VKYILRQTALTALSFALLYGAAIGLAFVFGPPSPPRAGWLDAWNADGTLYLTSPKYAFLGRDVLNVPDQKILLIGASNTGAGFSRGLVNALVPCAKVSSLAVGRSNITEVRQMIDLVHEVQNEAARKSNTFVIGVWFGMLVDDETFWTGTEREPGDTDIDIERYRYGFYRRTAAGPAPVLPPKWLHLEVTLIRPYLLLEKVARDLTARLRQELFVRKPNLTDADREAIVMSQEDKAAALAFWRQTIGRSISQAQIDLLRNSIEGLLRSGEKVVIVDLPIPAWHRNASPYYAEYAQAMQSEIFDHFANRPGFAVLHMNDLDGDLDYSDEVHPKPHLARIWAARLADVLNPLVCGRAPASVVDKTRHDRLAAPAGESASR